MGADARQVIFRSNPKWPPGDKFMLILGSVQCKCLCNGSLPTFWHFANTQWSTDVQKVIFLDESKMAA